LRSAAFGSEGIALVSFYYAEDGFDLPCLAEIVVLM
jgi:hypothetical protein